METMTKRKNQRTRANKSVTLRREEKSLNNRKISLPILTSYAYCINFMKKAMFLSIELANDCTFLIRELER